MDNILEKLEISPNQPLYLYQQPMFSITVSTVLIVDAGVFLVEQNDVYKFPGGIVRAGQETIQFAAVRHIKEQTGITLKKEVLIPVDFRSDPERSKEKNIIDIGFVCILNNITPDYTHSRKGLKWETIDFENKCLAHKHKVDLYMDHSVLLERALDVIYMMK